MFYIGLQGGLGNQMFQYAFGRAASIESGIPFSLDISKFGNEGPKYTQRSFTLQHFNIQTPIATASEIAKFHTPRADFFRKIKKRLRQKDDHVFNPELLRVKKGQYLEGFWQSEKYFKNHADTIRREFSLKNTLGSEAKQVLTQIEDLKSKGVETILIHVRRGDFVSNKASLSLLGILGDNYFSEGVKQIDNVLNQNGNTSPRHIFFATEDPEWVKQNITPDHDSTIISRPGIYDFEEIILMSACNHFVISNSTYSWWAAWLSHNTNKIVVAPKIWMQGNPNVKTDDLVPTEWLRV
jgi:hypothetical protein